MATRRRIPAPNPEHLEFLKPYGPAVTRLVVAVRRVVLEESPGAVELIYDAYSAVSAGYSFTGRPSDCSIYVAAYPKGVNIGLRDGTAVPDPDRLLEGTGRRGRHVKIRDLADLARPGVRALIQAAVE